MSYPPISFVRGGYVSDMNRLGFKEGGEVTKEEPSEILAKNPDVPFVKRINNPQDYPYPEENEDGSISTHLLSAETDEDGNAWVFPTKVYKDKEYKTYTEEERFQALDDAKSSGNALQFNNITEADVFSQNYKTDKFKEYYRRKPLVSSIVSTHKDMYYDTAEWLSGVTDGVGDNIVDSSKQALYSTLNAMTESTSSVRDTIEKYIGQSNITDSIFGTKEDVAYRRNLNIQLQKDKENRTPKNLSLTQQGVRGAIESSPITAVAMIATLVTKSPAFGLTIMGSYTGSLEYDIARQSGKDVSQSLMYGAVQGNIEAWTERLGLKPLMKMFKSGGNQAVKNGIAYVTREIIGENAAEFGQSMVSWGAGLDEVLSNPKLSTKDRLIIQAQRQYVATIAATAITTVTIGGKSGIETVKNRLESNVSKLANETQQTLDSKTVDQTTLQQEDIQLEIDESFDTSTVEHSEDGNEKRMVITLPNMGEMSLELPSWDEYKDWKVEAVSIGDKYKGKGAGVRVYIKAIEELLKRGDANYMSTGGMTTESAMRVWRSLETNANKIKEDYPQLRGTFTVTNNESNMMVHEGGKEPGWGVHEETTYEQDIDSEAAFTIELHPKVYEENIKKLENKKSIIEKRLEETPLKKVNKSSLDTYWDEASNSMELILKPYIYKQTHPSGKETYKGINPEVEEMLHEALIANLSVVAKTTSLTIDAKEQGTDKVRRIQVDTMDELNELIKLMKENSKTLNASRPKDPELTIKVEPKPQAFERTPIGGGMEQLSTDDIALVGGGSLSRSGNSKGDELRSKYMVYDLKNMTKNDDMANANDYLLGEVEVFVEDGTGKLRGLVEMTIKDKKKGTGRKIIESLMASDFVADDFTIHSIKNTSVPFWEKMGVEFKNKTAIGGYRGDGVIRKNIGKPVKEYKKPEPLPSIWEAKIERKIKEMFPKYTEGKYKGKYVPLDGRVVDWAEFQIQQWNLEQDTRAQMLEEVGKRMKEAALHERNMKKGNFRRGGLVRQMTTLSLSA